MAIKTFSISLEQVKCLSSDVKHFIFSVDNEDTFDFIPGQFITLLIEHESKTYRRSYSLANRLQNGKVEFAASFIPNGIASNLLFNLKVGDSLTAQGPFGRLILQNKDAGKRLILVGTSTGITPYLSMLSELKDALTQKQYSEAIIIQGVPKKNDILYQEHFLTFAEDGKQSQFFCALSQESEDTSLMAHECLGRVQNVLNKLNLSADNDIVYLCGNPQMIDDVFALLKEAQFDVKSIRREKYISK